MVQAVEQAIPAPVTVKENPTILADLTPQNIPVLAFALTKEAFAKPEEALVDSRELSPPERLQPHISEAEQAVILKIGKNEQENLSLGILTMRAGQPVPNLLTSVAVKTIASEIGIPLTADTSSVQLQKIGGVFKHLHQLVTAERIVEAAKLLFPELSHNEIMRRVKFELLVEKMIGKILGLDAAGIEAATDLSQHTAFQDAREVRLIKELEGARFQVTTLQERMSQTEATHEQEMSRLKAEHRLAADAWNADQEKLKAQITELQQKEGESTAKIEALTSQIAQLQKKIDQQREAILSRTKRMTAPVSEREEIAGDFAAGDEKRPPEEDKRLEKRRERPAL